MGNYPALQALLLLWAAMLIPGATLAEGAEPPVPFWGNKTVLNVCTSETTPMVFCSDRAPKDFTGYEIALFAKVRVQLGWEDSMLNWTCMDWDSVVNNLEAADGTCDIAVNGLNVMTDYLDRGLVFTWPTFRNGLKVLVASGENTVDYWAFLHAFSVEVWVATVLTAVGVAVIIWAVEMWATAGKEPAAAANSAGANPKLAAGLQQTVFTSLGRPMQLGEMLGRSFAANVIVILYAFLVLVLVALYTATCAANITAVRLETTIRGVQDLPGKAVGSWGNYVTDLQREGVAAMGFPWDSLEDEHRMFDALRNGLVRALVLDGSFLDYTSASECDITVVGEQFAMFDQAVAFPRGFNNSELLSKYNDILVQLRESGEMENLISEYVSSPPAPCKSESVSSDSSQVTFEQVAGLWIMLGGGIAAALLLAAAHQFALWNARRVARTQWFKEGSRRLSRKLTTMRSWSAGRPQQAGSAAARGRWREGDLGDIADAAVAAADKERAALEEAADSKGECAAKGGSPLQEGSQAGRQEGRQGGHLEVMVGMEALAQVLAAVQVLQQEQRLLAQQVQQLLSGRDTVQ